MQIYVINPLTRCKIYQCFDMGIATMNAPCRQKAKNMELFTTIFNCS